ncbi:MAG: HEPN domain-containing protein [Candidatus Aenigmarchaeota archaeon]|nr:HEPN domain-containing protein [Candidatus Aenigmarchaeota archaeon]MDI6722570.1 HEPN domain-containing protein [Candidatus Aenigmarchaeota archaeon]
MKEETKKWINQADEEFDTARINFEAKKYFSAAFWCQQSVEKAFKALLIQKTSNFPKIHDLTRLAKLLDAPPKLIEMCAKINPAYTASRYPDSIKSYSKKECEKILDYTKEALKWAKENLMS